MSDKDFAKLMRMVHMGKVGNKNANFKEMNKANKRRNEKFEREKMKIINERATEQAERDSIEWAITDNTDVKYQKKTAAKQAAMDYDGPS